MTWQSQVDGCQAWAGTEPSAVAAARALRLARTLDAWQQELLAAFTRPNASQRATGPAEAVNMLSKKIRASAKASGVSEPTGYGCRSRLLWSS